MACSAQSAQIGGYFSLSTTGPSKGVLFFNFLIVSHVATLCTFDPMQVELLELFFAQLIVGMNCVLHVPTTNFKNSNRFDFLFLH